MPEEAAAHADTVFLGPGEDTWPAFLADLRAGRPRPRYESRVRTLDRLPPIRRDLIQRHLYLVPNSIVVGFTRTIRHMGPNGPCSKPVRQPLTTAVSSAVMLTRVRFGPSSLK